MKRLLLKAGQRFIRGHRALEAVRHGERYLKQVQGKGWGGAFTIDQEVRGIFPLLPKNNAVVLDVGGNRGDWTRSLLKLAGPRIAKVYVFEPSAAHREALATIPDPRVTIINAAVGATDGVATLHAEHPGSGRASLHRRFHLAQNIDEQVTTLALSSFVEQHQLETIHFMKMDIEGHELEALKGAQPLLEQQRIRALSFEFGESNLASRTFFHDFWQLLTNHGYTLSRIVPGPTRLPIPRYTDDLETFLGATNYVATLK